MNAGSEFKASENTKKVVVIGAGIIGVVAAISILRDGHEVVLVDRDDPGEGCSFGNAGLLARSSFVPLAGPSTFLSVPKWILDPNGPLSIRWSYLHKMLPWLFRYIKSGLLDDLEANGRAMHVLTDPCVDLYARLAEQAGCQHLIKETDYLQIYRSKSAFVKAQQDMNARRKLGIRIEDIDGADIQELEPGLSPSYQYGFRIHDHGYVTDPGALVKNLAELFCKRGGTFRKAHVESLKSNALSGCQVFMDGETEDCDKIVLAAGAFSARLADKIGVTVPLETERGYHITCADPGPSLTRPVMEGDRKFLATPMDMGMRFAGTVELGGLDAPLNQKRIETITTHAKSMIEGINTDNASFWLGFRPTLPDSLPVIGPCPDNPNIIFAFGHQHLGLTCAPKTANLVADMVTGRIPNVDMAPYAASRFY